MKKISLFLLVFCGLVAVYSQKKMDTVSKKTVVLNKHQIQYNKYLGDYFFEQKKYALALKYYKELERSPLFQSFIVFDKYIDIKTLSKDTITTSELKKYTALKNRFIKKYCHTKIDSLNVFKISYPQNSDSSLIGTRPTFYKEHHIVLAKNRHFSDKVNHTKIKPEYDIHLKNSLFFSDNDKELRPLKKTIKNKFFYRKQVIYTPYFSKKDSVFYFSSKQKCGTSKSQTSKCYFGIYKARYKNGLFIYKKALRFTKNQHDYLYPTLSDDGKMLYFMTNELSEDESMQWCFIEIDSLKKEPTVRTVKGLKQFNGTITTPYIQDNTLFFASDKDGTFDIYKASIKDYETLETPIEKLSKSFNSDTHDEYGFLPRKGLSSGYYFSNKNSMHQLYEFKIINKPIRVNINVNEYGKSQKIDTFFVEVKSIGKKGYQDKLNSECGFLEFDLPNKDNYVITINHPKYISHKVKIFSQPFSKKCIYNLDLDLHKLDSKFNQSVKKVYNNISKITEDANPIVSLIDVALVKDKKTIGHQTIAVMDNYSILPSSINDLKNILQHFKLENQNAEIVIGNIFDNPNAKNTILEAIGNIANDIEKEPHSPPPLEKTLKKSKKENIQKDGKEITLTLFDENTVIDILKLYVNEDNQISDYEKRRLDNHIKRLPLNGKNLSMSVGNPSDDKRLISYVVGTLMGSEPLVKNNISLLKNDFDAVDQLFYGTDRILIRLYDENDDMIQQELLGLSNHSEISPFYTSDWKNILQKFNANKSLKLRFGNKLSNPTQIKQLINHLYSEYDLDMSRIKDSKIHISKNTTQEKEYNTVNVEIRHNDKVIEYKTIGFNKNGKISIQSKKELDKLYKKFIAGSQGFTLNIGKNNDDISSINSILKDLTNYNKKVASYVTIAKPSKEQNDEVKNDTINNTINFKVVKRDKLISEHKIDLTANNKLAASSLHTLDKIQKVIKENNTATIKIGNKEQDKTFLKKVANDFVSIYDVAPNIIEFSDASPNNDESHTIVLSLFDDNTKIKTLEIVVPNTFILPKYTQDRISKFIETLVYKKKQYSLSIGNKENNKQALKTVFDYLSTSPKLGTTRITTNHNNLNLYYGGKANINTLYKQVILDNSNIPFGYNSYDLSPTAMGIIIEIAKDLSENADKTIVIKGYPDIKDGKTTNEWIAQKRAKNIFDFIEALSFIDMSRVNIEEDEYYSQNKPKEDEINVPTTNIEDVILSPIHFELNATAISKVYFKQLDIIASYLKNHPKIKLRISTYTDSTGNKKKNYLLSQRRNESIFYYLRKIKNVDKNQIVLESYGEQNFLNNCKESENCSMKEHNINRRSEFELVNSVL